ncbi:MAG: hypothetical protein KKD27_02490 [Gammaproteobacteria bacterium]|jgi:hypothetical protein|uniref:hypothetical protein n=1 Tax=Stutzerimonas xanthomarina TaxID=271420 RepID=UPI00190C4E11|nr:hypothetical protein [Stutzerimonas xanthomarina]MBU0811281.1 hypothetical protein [Gammaproteobacteria bacterium]MBK3844821.1 hypothetical protein [Stutzerimonas xanthomarina]MBU0852816.1 hypothetical protein [Gammaproteobacteria bacterium]MBU1303049.1 hypothetical protein [Gammaproteobacteria bacterium]MBU1459403.1 hypothetical protein [Gammaproteobacteria bacterium]|tara:strand:+ start:269 stop:520 length:252 start_codon:yes stop_codon:yes gene_type:complete
MSILLGSGICAAISGLAISMSSAVGNHGRNGFGAQVLQLFHCFLFCRSKPGRVRLIRRGVAVIWPASFSLPFLVNELHHAGLV